MGVMAGKAAAAGKRRMPTSLADFLAEIFMTGHTERTDILLPEQFRCPAALVRIMTLAAFASGKRLMQAETVHLPLNPFMAALADCRFLFHKQGGVRRRVRPVAAQTLTLPCRRMPVLTATELILGMTLVTQGRPAGQFETLLRALAMSGMAGQTLTLGKRSMLLLLSLRLRMTLYTELLRLHSKHALLITGMNSMAIHTFPFGNRRMLVCHRTGLGLVTLSAHLCRLRRSSEFASRLNTMTGAAISSRCRFMHYGAQEPFLFGTVRIMTTHATAGKSIAEVGGQKSFFLTFVAFQAKLICTFPKQGGLVCAMGIMAGGASLAQRGMKVLLFIRRTRMTGIAELTSRLVQQGDMFRIMCGMTGGTVAMRKRSMHRDLSLRDKQFAMTAETELRHFLPEKHTADKPMGQMTGAAVFFLNRDMHLSRLKLGRHFRMAIQATLLHSLRLCLLDAGREKNSRHTRKEQTNYFSRRRQSFQVPSAPFPIPFHQP